jgi:hypothetical protein
MWGWMGVALAVALAYYFWKQKSSSAASSNTSTSSDTTGQTADTSTDQIPQFVNQTYVQNTPPAPDMPATPVPAVPAPTPAAPAKPAPAAPSIPNPLKVSIVPPHYLDRSYTLPNASSTLADLAKQMKITNPADAFHPANTIAKTFMSTTYPKNHNAKIPKGAQFTYVTGS